MSALVCKKTGIILTLNDGIEADSTDEASVYILAHPLATYSQVVKAFKYKSKVNDQHKTLLAGSILSVLQHHHLLRIHNDNEVVMANNSLVVQAKSAHQLLVLLHRLLKNEERLDTIARGFQVRGEWQPRRFNFCLESAQLQGHEQEGANQYFLANLRQWINELLPTTASELKQAIRLQASLNTNSSKDMPIEFIELNDGQQVAYTDVMEELDRVKVQLENEIFRRSRRLPLDKIRRKVMQLSTLMMTYNIFNRAQHKRLGAMVKAMSYNEVILHKAIQVLEQAAKVEANQIRRTKIHTLMAWLKASDVEFKRRGDELEAFEVLIEEALHKGDKDEAGESEVKPMTLQERLDALKLKNREKV